MGRLAYFQAFNGISGDMTLGALLDAGLSFEDLAQGLEALQLEGYRLEARKVLRGALHATRARVVLEDPHHASEGHSHHHHAREGEGHDSPSEATSPASSGTPRRGLSDILRLIDRSSLAPEVKERAGAVFRRLAEAEARVHGIALEEVHFHEVGAVDSIVDTVGSCLGLHLLEVDEIHSSIVSVGAGFVEGSHGKLPLPAPATLELLRGFPVRQVGSADELTTPTGAALLTTLSKSFGLMPPSRPTAIGYGAGSDRPGPVPNVLRVILANRLGSLSETDRVLLLETNIDDMSPQWLGHLMEKLFAAGALDVFMTPILMKKSRQAHQVSVIAPLEREGDVAETLFTESTTFGVRRSEVDRLVLARAVHTVETPWGSVRIKVGSLAGREASASPEYEDLRRAAANANLPLKLIHQRVLELFRNSQPR